MEGVKLSNSHQIIIIIALISLSLLSSIIKALTGPRGFTKWTNNMHPAVSYIAVWLLALGALGFRVSDIIKQINQSPFLVLFSPMIGL